MNKLTVQGRRDYAAERRADTLLAVGCGLVFAALSIAFFI